jgi:glycosyltransferase involved in cell wall biosynthesis
MINIALSYSKFATSESGGARESLLTLLNGISETRDIKVDAYQTPPVDDPPDMNFEYHIHTKYLQSVPKLTWLNQVINRIQWKRYLRSVLKSEHDILITQNRLAPASVDVANDLNIPSLCFIRSMALTGYEKYSPDLGHLQNLRRTDLGGRVQYPFLRKNFHDYRRGGRNATRTIANSEFTARKIKELFGTDSTVIYPPIKTENYRAQYDRDGYITMVNPRTKYKGPDIFLNIAERMSKEEFLLVGPIGTSEIEQRAKRLPNVTHWEWCEDMRDAYSKAKVVVVPSRVEESFGRVPAEAMVSGIPCVVSDRGGLPEVVGDTGEIVAELETTECWIRAIHQALESHDPEAQKRRVEKFSAGNQIKKLQRVIDKMQLDK